MKAKLLWLPLAVLLAFLVRSPAIALEKAAEAAPSPSSKACQEAPPTTRQKPRTAAAEKGQQRADALRAVMARLGLGEGATVADIGAGNGRDTWVFADVVGPQGKVYSEEITRGMVDSLKEEAKRRGLPQLHAVLGRADDPCLPNDSVDLAYMGQLSVP